MNKVNISAVPVEHRRSPQGRFALERRHVSLALGGVKDTGAWGGGYPFDVESNPLRPRAFGGKGAEGMKKEIPSNKTDAGNGSYGICRVIDASRSPSPDPNR